MATDVLTKPVDKAKPDDAPDMTKLLGLGAKRRPGSAADFTVQASEQHGSQAAAFRLKVLQKRQNMGCDALSIAKEAPDSMQRLFR
ncbi:MAG: hypothetical protein AAF439_11710 [Pseudomonadota bacterium]